MLSQSLSNRLNKDLKTRLFGLCRRFGQITNSNYISVFVGRVTLKSKHWLKKG